MIVFVAPEENNSPDQSSDCDVVCVYLASVGLWKVHQRKGVSSPMVSYRAFHSTRFCLSLLFLAITHRCAPGSSNWLSPTSTASLISASMGRGGARLRLCPTSPPLLECITGWCRWVPGRVPVNRHTDEKRARRCRQPPITRAIMGGVSPTRRCTIGSKRRKTMERIFPPALGQKEGRSKAASFDPNRTLAPPIV